MKTCLCALANQSKIVNCEWCRGMKSKWNWCYITGCFCRHRRRRELLLFWVYQFCGIKSKQNKWALKQSNLCCSLLFLIVLYFSKCHCYCCLFFISFDSFLFRWRFKAERWLYSFHPLQISDLKVNIEHAANFFNNNHSKGDAVKFDGSPLNRFANVE